MPVYEYQCRKCGETTTFIEKVDEFKFFSRKCRNCGSRKIKKVLSSFSTKKNESTSDMINELKKYGKVNFLPKQSGLTTPHGPPPGGCPYAGDPNKKTETKG